jgi:hypothetical protein
MAADMIDFERFVKTLGPDATRYTPGELRQLHVEVHKLAEILLGLSKAKRAGRTKSRSPQPDLDSASSDRTMQLSAHLTPRDDVSTSSADPP